mgnify:CR=1 FL=1
MDKLACMRAFVTVVEGGGFSEAARRMGVSKALISKQIGQLERTWTCACYAALRERSHRPAADRPISTNAGRCWPNSTNSIQ